MGMHAQHHYWWNVKDIYCFMLIKPQCSSADILLALCEDDTFDYQQVMIDDMPVSRFRIKSYANDIVLHRRHVLRRETRRIFR